MTGAPGASPRIRPCRAEQKSSGGRRPSCGEGGDRSLETRRIHLAALSGGPVGLGKRRHDRDDDIPREARAVAVARGSPVCPPACPISASRALSLCQRRYRACPGRPCCGAEFRSGLDAAGGARPGSAEPARPVGAMAAARLGEPCRAHKLGRAGSASRDREAQLLPQRACPGCRLRDGIPGAGAEWQRDALRREWAGPPS